MAASGGAATQAARQVWKLIVSGKRFEGVLNKVNITSASPGKCSCELTVGEEQANRRGSLHGGFVSTLVDTLTTVAVLSSPAGVPGVSVELSVSFMQAARIGDQLTMDAEVIKAGKSLAFTKANLYNSKGDIIAVGNHVKHVGRKDTPEDRIELD
ncbi:acyl-coenzyme A thioesterase 13-like [Acanthaster planci]|uniref:Acyl-coenzyme A thioesterase 13 n=1 Tax=Acanthaster planci TaxID=133434 RepID=A0A8B7Y8P7_ACAPL|nr:acyl-coenzyme A thioesterase 13-like [Acanthaster planci]